jgi:hypothetical protein
MLRSLVIGWRGVLGDKRDIHLLLRCEGVEELEAVGVPVAQLAELWKWNLELQGIRSKAELQIPQLTRSRVIWVSWAA